jgi:SPP1 family phage portal protein
MRMELDNLQKFINKFTHTADISFESMKGLSQFSGVALKMLFLDSHLKASDDEEIFGEGVQRRINYLKYALASADPKVKSAISMQIKPKFTYFLPENTQEKVQMITEALSAGIISKKTAIYLNPLVTDHEEEEKRIEAEEAKKRAIPPPPPPKPPTDPAAPPADPE